jgi:hypothetical protein
MKKVYYSRITDFKGVKEEVRKEFIYELLTMNRLILGAKTV